MKKMKNECGFSKYEVDGLNIYIYNGLELKDEIEVKYLYSIPIIGTVLSASGIKIKS